MARKEEEKEMCKMKVVVLREMLGAREICWSVWDGKQVQEMTSNQIKTLLKAGTKVSGLKVSKDGELEPDQEGFYCKNIMEHRHCGNYTPMFSEECMWYEGMSNHFDSPEDPGYVVLKFVADSYNLFIDWQSAKGSI